MKKQYIKLEPHNGIHTCSKGCKKQGCNRGLRDTIEEQNAQIEGLKRDLLEKTAAVRSQFANSEQENARLNNYIERLEVRNAELVPENARLKAEVERLKYIDVIASVSSGKSILIYLAEIDSLKAQVEAVTQEYRDATNHYNKLHNDLQAEVERIKTQNAYLKGKEYPNTELGLMMPKYLLEHWMEENARLKAEVERLTKAIEGSSYYFMSIKLSVENARLRKAGDAMERSLAFEYPDSPKVKDWNAAKEGKPSV